MKQSISLVLIFSFLLNSSILLSTLIANQESIESEKIVWEGNRIVSRVLPYPDFTSFFIRLPIAHKAATGKGIKIGILSKAPIDKSVSQMIKEVAPDSEIITCIVNENEIRVEATAVKDCRVVMITDPQKWAEKTLLEFIERSTQKKITVILPSDFSEERDVITKINRAHQSGAITVGRVNRQSLVMISEKLPFNKFLRDIDTDIFSTVGIQNQDLAPAVCVSGVVALILQKWPEFSPSKIREQLITRARKVWQATSIESGRWQIESIEIDPITTEYKVKDEKSIFRFNVLDAASSLEIDTKIPWPWNMLNLQKAWEISKGKNVTIAITDQGFHINHPELVHKIENKAQFGPLGFDEPKQNFHGTDMSRIALSVAPESRIVLLLCSAQDTIDMNNNLAENISKSFLFAKENKLAIISSSWGGNFIDYPNVLTAIREAVDSGVVVSWFHYPNEYPGVIRSDIIFPSNSSERRLCFADRFLTDPAGFHPVEIEAGLSGTAPQAAGIAALIKSVNPQLSPKEIKDLIINNSTPIGKGIYIPDAYQSVLAAKNLTKK